MSYNLQNHSKKSLWVVIISLTVIFIILFSLNSFFTKQNKNNTGLINKVITEYNFMGDKNAKVILVEYADFQCPACSVYSLMIKRAYNEINNEFGSSSLAVNFKHFPLMSVHKNAMISAQSVEAAGLQGKFWEMHDLLFIKQEEWGNALDAKIKIEGYAKSLGLDIDKFILDRDSENIINKINNAYKEAHLLKLSGTPSFFLNGVEIKNISNYEELKKQILEKLEANTSINTISTK